jgi:hypothetical protein
MKKSKSKKNKKKNVFDVEKILDSRIENGVVKYLLKWKNYSDEYNTWEPEENLNCPKLLNEFIESKHKNEKSLKREDESHKINAVYDLLYDTNKIPMKIIGISNQDDEKKYLLQWKNEDESNIDFDLVSFEYANSFLPNLVIKYYEEILEWNDDDIIQYDNEISNAPDAFENGFKPKEIVYATNVNGKFMFMMEWKDSEEPDLVFAEIANKICPELVIKFYQSQLDED